MKNMSLVLIGPNNLFPLLEEELDDFNMENDLKKFRKWFCSSPNQRIYIIYRNNSRTVKDLSMEVRCKLRNIDKSAIVKEFVYMVNHIDDFGDYLFITCDDKSKCFDTLHSLFKQNQLINN